jgi:hypothetical protein
MIEKRYKKLCSKCQIIEKFDEDLCLGCGFVALKNEVKKLQSTMQTWLAIHDADNKKFSFERNFLDEYQILLDKVRQERRSAGYDYAKYKGLPSISIEINNWVRSGAPKEFGTKLQFELLMFSNLQDTLTDCVNVWEGLGDTVGPIFNAADVNYRAKKSEIEKDYKERFGACKYCGKVMWPNERICYEAPTVLGVDGKCVRT